MVSNNSPLSELATARVGYPWSGHKKVVLLFEQPYSITEFLVSFDKLRLDPDPLDKSQISNNASRIFYTFSGLHLLLKQVDAVAIRGLDHSSSIEIEELKERFESCSDYFTEFTRLLKVVEISFLELILAAEEKGDSLEISYLEHLVQNELMIALEESVREDRLLVPYLLTLLESEGLNISVSLIQRLLSGLKLEA